MLQAILALVAALILLAFSTLVGIIIYQNQKAVERRDHEMDRLKSSVVYEDTCQRCRVRSDELLSELSRGQKETNTALLTLLSEVAVLNDRVKGE
jgi:hypothetical protein